MFGNKLSVTLAKVQSFVNDLEQGIEGNNSQVKEKQVKIEAINKEVNEINKETAIATKLLAKLK